MIDYGKRLVEVDEILKYLSKDNIMKIPEEIRQIIKNNRDKEYVWKYDINKSLNEQKLNRDTIAILSYLNIEYLLNSDQKEIMEYIHKLNELKLEKQKEKNYNPNNMFKNKGTEKTEEDSIENNDNTVLVKYKETFFTKFKNFIFKLLRIKKG